LDLLPVQDIAKANIEENVLTNQVCSMIW
jgi:hypothetical protein